MVLKAQDLYMEYGERVLFQIDDLELHSGDRVGLVGRNGCGKTTLMNTLCGYAQPVGGTVTAYAPLAMIPQFSDDTDGSQIVRRQRELWGIPEEALSGGERTKLLIARAMGRESGALFCDEPTSNLDAEGIARLEEALAAYVGALVIVSHDRALLDKFCQRIWELEDGHLRVYRGNWSDYRAQKEKEHRRAWDEYENYTAERGHLLEAARGAMARSKSVKKAPSRMGNSEARLHRREATEVSEKLARSGKVLERRLERLEVKEKPRDAARVRLSSRDVQASGARVLLQAKDLHFSWPQGPEILRGLSFTVERGMRLAITGANGAGKTTLLHCLWNGSPRVWEPPGVVKGYFRQDLSLLRGDWTLLQNVMEGAAVPVQTARNMLARVLLSADSLQRPAGVLSGGERAKAALVKLLASQANLLLLDEPTNFLDVYALEGLEDMMSQFPGTIIFVSHDRYFTDKLATHELQLRQGRLSEPEAPKTIVADDTAARRMALQLRRDGVLARLSQAKAGPAREALEQEFLALEAQLKAIPNP